MIETRLQAAQTGPDRHQQPDPDRRTAPNPPGMIRPAWETDPPGLHPPDQTGTAPDPDRRTTPDQEPDPDRRTAPDQHQPRRTTKQRPRKIQHIRARARIKTAREGRRYSLGLPRRLRVRERRNFLGVRGFFRFPSGVREKVGVP